MKAENIFLSCQKVLNISVFPGCLSFRRNYSRVVAACLMLSLSSDSFALKTLDDVDYDHKTYIYTHPLISSNFLGDGKLRTFNNAVEALNVYVQEAIPFWKSHGYEIVFRPIFPGPVSGCLSQPAYLNGSPHMYCAVGDLYKNGTFQRKEGSYAMNSYRCDAPWKIATFPTETTAEGYKNALAACAKFKPYYLVEPNKAPDCTNGGASVGNPIDVLSGIKRQSIVDVSVSGVDFVRHYRSAVSALKNELGVNWSHSFSPFLNGPKAIGTARFKYSQGHSIKLIGTGKYDASYVCAEARGRSAPTTVVRLRSNYSNICDEIDQNKVIKSYAITDRTFRPGTNSDLFTIVRETGEYFAFARSNGQWTDLSRRPAVVQGFESSAPETGTITYPDGVQETFTNGLLTQRTLTNGRTLTLRYDDRNLLREVREAEAVLYSFTHDEAGYLSTVSFGSGTITYERDEQNNLGRVTQVDGSVITYHYEDANFPHALTGITDERGVRFATWQYDSQGRAISSEHGNGKERVTLDYSHAEDTAEPRIITTNALGKQTVYHLTSVNGNKRIDRVEGFASDNCAASSRDYEYFPDGSLSAKTDWEGNTITYQRDAFGREISRTEAAGTSAARTTLTEFHPTLNLPVKITEGNKVTVLNYDDAGRLLSKIQQSTTTP